MTVEAQQSESRLRKSMRLQPSVLAAGADASFMERPALVNMVDAQELGFIFSAARTPAPIGVYDFELHFPASLFLIFPEFVSVVFSIPYSRLKVRVRTFESPCSGLLPKAFTASCAMAVWMVFGFREVRKWFLDSALAASFGFHSLLLLNMRRGCQP